MLTSAFITLLQENFGAALTRTKLLEAVNRAQNEILGVGCQLMRIKPDPFLTTVLGTYTYQASDALFDASTGAKGAAAGDIRAVRAIFIDTTNLSSIDQLALDTNFTRITYTEVLPRENKVHIKFDSTDSLGPLLDDCVIKWPALYNPGATTITWRAEAYKWPNQLTSESIALSVPEDFQESLLMEKVAQRIERREYGRDDDRAAAFRAENSRFRLKYNKMPSQSGDLTCHPRNL